jgi:DNA-directed RNA polymerase specialized sigma24 family protein
VAAEVNLVLEAVAGLPDPMREVVVAVDVLGLTYAETGKALGVHENTIPSRLASAAQGGRRAARMIRRQRTASCRVMEPETTCTPSPLTS